jgi:ATP-binding cassette, subfamily B, bacterial PglK
MYFFKIISSLLNKKQKKEFYFTIFLNFIHFIFEFIAILSIPMLAACLIDPAILLNKVSILNEYLSKDNLLFFLGIFVCTAFILKIFFYILVVLLQEKFYKNLKISISTTIFNFYLNTSYRNLHEVGPHYVTRNLTHDVAGLRAYLFSFNNLIRETLAFIIIFALIFISNWKIAISLFSVFLMLSFIFIKLLKPTLQKIALQNQKIAKNFNELVFDLFGAIKDIKIFSKEASTSKNFFLKTSQYEKNLFFFGIIDRLPKAFVELFAVIIFVVIVLSMSFLSSDFSETLAVLSVAVVAVVRSIPAFTGVNSSLHIIRFYEPSLNIISLELKKINEFKDIRNEKKPIIKLPHNEKFDEFLSVKKMTFYYNNLNQKILDKVNMNIKEGEKVAIIGKTGAGKSTLMQLLIGLLEPNHGSILYKDQNISDHIKIWHQQISYVSQKCFLLDANIKHNISFESDNSNIDIKKLHNATEVAEIKEKILSLNNGFEEYVGTDGTKLSGGEKQRIALARAIYHNKKILFLDEFTSSLDRKTEQKIFNNLNEIKERKTLVIIAHREETINKCDAVWELINGNLKKIK